MKTVAIIQARMNSSRFPGKHLATLAGRPMIDHVVSAVRKAELPFIIATSDHPSDDPLAAFARARGWEFYRGSLDNPLERTYFAAVRVECDSIVRITADCCLVDWRTIQKMVSQYRQGGPGAGFIDYVGSTNSPDGNDVEVFSFSALSDARGLARADEIEHTTTWIRKNKRCVSEESDPKYNGVHYSVNTVEDLKLCERLIQKCGEGAHYQDYANAYLEIMG